MDGDFHRRRHEHSPYQETWIEKVESLADIPSFLKELKILGHVTDGSFFDTMTYDVDGTSKCKATVTGHGKKQTKRKQGHSGNLKIL